MKEAANTLKLIQESNFCGGHFPLLRNGYKDNKTFESHVAGLFSDIWLDMTDDIYFDQSFEFTKERFLKNNIDPYKFFKDKTVLDAGCGSGKFSCSIARFGAKKVIAMDIGEKALNLLNYKQKKQNMQIYWIMNMVHY